jgi:hypothetical protein
MRIFKANIMKTFSLSILALVLAPCMLMAQSEEAMKKIEAARIALITERLELSPEQAEKFWPIYREYNNKRRELRTELRNARRDVNPSELTEEQSRELMALAMEIKQRELKLEQDYSGRLQAIITSRQLLRLKNAEQDFHKMLLQRLQSERERQLQRRNMMERREMMKPRDGN